MSDVPLADDGGIRWRPNVCVATEAAASCPQCHPIPTPEGSPDLYWCEGSCPEAVGRCAALQGTSVTTARSPYYNVWAIVILAILFGLFFLIVGLLLGSLIRWGGNKSVKKETVKNVTPTRACLPHPSSSGSCMPCSTSPYASGCSAVGEACEGYGQPQTPSSQCATFVQLPSSSGSSYPAGSNPQVAMQLPVGPYQSAQGPFSQSWSTQAPYNTGETPVGEWVYRRYR